MYRPRQPRQRWDSRMNLALALLPLLLLSGAAFSTDEGAASSTASGKDENILTLLSTNTTDLHDSFGTDGREAADGTAATALPSPQSTPSETSNSIGDESLSTNFTILDSDVVWIPNPGRHPTSPERDERVSGAADTIPTPAPTSTGNASFPSSELKPQTQNQTKSDSENSNKATVDEALQRLASEVYVPNGSPASRYATLKNRIAKAQLSSREGDVALGEVTFDWCHNNRLQDESYPSVLVHVNFRNFNCSFGWGARRSPDEPENRCAYQISQEGVKRPDNGGACSAYSKVYDPMRAAVQKGGQESDIDLILEELFGEPRDKCDSTHNSNKLHSCPVGSLSRTHGTSLMYYDRTLGVQNDIIGRTFLLVSSTNTSSFDYALSCSPIAFWDNCEISGEIPGAACGHMHGSA